VRVTRRGLQLALGSLWLLDAALQFQPYMFTHAFARDVILPTGNGQPAIVAIPVHFAGHLIVAHPAASNTVFALVQLALAVGLFLRRTNQVALFASIGWSAAVWWLGEGMGGLASGHAMLLTGAPGAVLLYAFVAVAAIPRNTVDGRGEAPSSSAVVGWVATWTAGALLQVLPGQNRGKDLAGAFRNNAANLPGWLADLTRSIAGNIDNHAAFVVALTLVAVLITASALVPGISRTASATAGSALAVGFWIFGQGFGLVLSGQSTDPNSGPLLVLLALATAASVSRKSSVAVAAPYPAVTTRGQLPAVMAMT